MKVKEYKIGKTIITFSKTEKGVYADIDHGSRHRLYYADNAEKLMSEMEWKAYSGEKVFLGKGEAKNKEDLRAQILKSTALPDIAYVIYGRYGYTISDIHTGHSPAIKGQGVITCEEMIAINKPCPINP